MDAHHLSPSAGINRQRRWRYLAAAGVVVVVLAVVVATLGPYGAPTAVQVDVAQPAEISPATAAPVAPLPDASAAQKASDPWDAIYVVRSGRQAMALRHSQPELMDLPRANVLVIGYGSNAATAWHEIKEARQILGDGTTPVIDLR